MDQEEITNDMDCKEILSWPDEDYYLQDDSGNDVARSLWDELNQSEEIMLCMMNDQTPVKENMDFGCDVFYSGESAKKSFEDCQESSLAKRRRMLQFDSGVLDDTDVLPSIATSKATEDCALLSNELLDMDLTSELDVLTDPLGDWWTQGCLNDIELQDNCDEMISLGAEDLIDMSGLPGVSAEVEVPKVPQITTPSPQIKFKGRKLPIKAPTTPASVAYPFELFKPSVIQGDVTLNDINRRIRSPPPYEFPCIKQTCLTSAISGKPVICKTKIRTEGGRGSITITRTRG